MRFPVLVVASLALLSACAVPPPADPEKVNAATDGQLITGSRIRTKVGTGQAVKSSDGRTVADQMRGTMENRPQGQ
jgi:hypothetical protein